MRENATIWMIGDHPDKDIFRISQCHRCHHITKKFTMGLFPGQADASFNHYSQLVKFVRELSEKL